MARYTNIIAVTGTRKIPISFMKVTPNILRNNVWAGMLGNHIIGLLFMEENLTGSLYLDLLEQSIHPLITQTTESNADEFHMEDIFFQ